jgi:hypothetical protein
MQARPSREQFEGTESDRSPDPSSRISLIRRITTFWYSASVFSITPRMRVTQTFDNIKDAIEHTARTYRRCAMAQSDSYLEIWCEKDALSGVLWTSRGMSSLTFLYGTALAIQRGEEAGKEVYNLPTRPTKREGQPTRPRFCW